MNIYQEIKEKLNIFDFVSDYVNLNSSKQGFCPFHNNTNTPCFSVSISKKMWSCFGGCGSGDVISFYEKIENLTHQEAVKNLAERLGINYKSLSAEEIEKQRKEKEQKEILIKIHEHAVLFYHEQLKENKEALEYLSNRGFTLETIDKFKLGYAQNGFTNLYNHLKDKFSKEDLLSSKLIKEKLTLYDTFINRIMIPITDGSGNPIAFGGRAFAFGGRALNSEDIKYINSSESLIYSKSNILFNYAWAKKYDSIILVEGYLDVIKPYQCGIKNIVASLGTALTENQAKLLLNHKEIIIAYDNDTAGLEATKRAITIIKDTAKKLHKRIDIDFQLKVLTQDKTKDLDLFLNQYPVSDLLKVIENAKDYKEIEVTEILESKSKNQVELNHYLRNYLRSLDETIKEDLYKRVITPFIKKNKKFTNTYEKHHFFTKTLRKALNLNTLFEPINKDPEIQNIDDIKNFLFDKSMNFNNFREELKQEVPQEIKEDLKDTFLNVPEVREIKKENNYNQVNINIDVNDLFHEYKDKEDPDKFKAIELNDYLNHDFIKHLNNDLETYFKSGTTNNDYIKLLIELSKKKHLSNELFDVFTRIINSDKDFSTRIVAMWFRSELNSKFKQGYFSYEK